MTPPVLNYYGLQNQGATCYLNSVLQILFMTKEFRETMKRLTLPNPDTQCLDHHLTNLFKDLENHTAGTTKITEELGIKNVCEQQDAAEYLEKILNNTNPEASQIFQGQLTHSNTCSVCKTEISSDGPFWSLPLALVGSPSENYSVNDGIKKYFSAKRSDGDNQMYCDQCDDKVDADTKFVIKHHPEVLMLLLKRFIFDYRHRGFVKNKLSVEVPYTLQIPENQTYELYAFVDHYGSLRGGHYTATVKSQDDEQWFQFNDTAVSPLDHQPLQVDSSQTAYLLFYKRKTKSDVNTLAQDNHGASTPGAFQQDTSDSDEQCQDAVNNTEEPKNQNVGNVRYKRPADYPDREQDISGRDSPKHKTKKYHDDNVNDHNDERFDNGRLKECEHLGDENKGSCHICFAEDQQNMVVYVKEKKSRSGADEMEEAAGSSFSCQDKFKVGDSNHSISKKDECKQVTGKTSQTEDNEQKRRRTGNLDDRQSERDDEVTAKGECDPKAHGCSSPLLCRDSQLNDSTSAEPQDHSTKTSIGNVKKGRKKKGRKKKSRRSSFWSRCFCFPCKKKAH